MNYCYGTDPEKIQASYSRNPPVVDQGDLGNSYYQNDSMNSRLIPLDGCSNSEAAHLLNERWLAAMNSYNDPSDLSEKPFMYTGASGSSWGHFKLPHQVRVLVELLSFHLQCQLHVLIVLHQHTSLFDRWILFPTFNVR
ncbi:hypothetical protein IHE45_10G051700 [Dioscorea alata]|uniref:Uncharacterized protein n=1 Tax=Dioscorea alata TaxID=55571 RepID=A0ACB7VAY6_DIOAL|nr:hypothetical protein IHE45_10G051700 [Dioscorea alata]